MHLLKHWVLNNFGFKLLSIFFGVILWFYVNAKGMIELNYVVPLEYHNLPSTLVIVGETVNYVDIRVKRREGFQDQSNVSQVAALVDLSEAKAGEIAFYLTDKNVRSTIPMEIMRISPRVIKVRIDPVVTKSVGVVPEVVGKPAIGIVLKGVEVDPPTVTVEGAKSLVAQLQKVSAGPINLNGARQTFSQEVTLKLSGKDIRVVDRGSVMVHVILGRENYN
jgi:YbbR domain-containing protein